VIGLTTGRESNQRLNTLLNELVTAIPNSRIERRGKSSKDELAWRLLDGGFTHAVIFRRWHGGPGSVDFFNVKPEGLNYVPPSALLKSVTLKREYGTHGTPKVYAITYEHTSSMIRRFGRVLSTILELPELESNHDIPCSLHLRESEAGAEIVVRSLAKMLDLGPKLVISKLLWSLQG
jgi:rRNA maturation protein Rpf1